jgi:hypothetical protein
VAIRRALANITNAASRQAERQKDTEPQLAKRKTAAIPIATDTVSVTKDVSVSPPERLVGPTWAEQEQARKEQERREVDSKVQLWLKTFNIYQLDALSDVSRDEESPAPTELPSEDAELSLDFKVDDLPLLPFPFEL